MKPLPLIIAFLVAVFTFIVLGFACRLINFRRTQSKEKKHIKPSQDWTDWLVPYLNLVPIPEMLVIRWGGRVVSRDLIQAGVDWDGRIFAGFKWVILWLAVGVGLLIGFLYEWDLLSIFLFGLILVGAFFTPQTWLGWRVQQRCESIDLNLPNFLDRLTLSMEAGLGFEIALRRISSTFPGLLGDEIRKLVGAIDRGHTRHEALDVFTGRTPSKDLGAFVTAVKQSDRLGTSLARTLRIQSQILRARRRRRAEEAGRRLPILIVFPLVFFFLPALLIVYLAPPFLHLFLGR